MSPRLTLSIASVLVVAVLGCSVPSREPDPGPRAPIAAAEGLCLHNRSDGRVLGTAVSYLPSANRRDTIFTVSLTAEFRPTLGETMEVTVPRNGTVRPCVAPR